MMALHWTTDLTHCPWTGKAYPPAETMQGRYVYRRAVYFDRDAIREALGILRGARAYGHTHQLELVPLPEALP